MSRKCDYCTNTARHQIDGRWLCIPHWLAAKQMLSGGKE